MGRGCLRVDALDGEAVTIEIEGGFCSVDQDVITIAADHAHRLGAAQSPQESHQGNGV